jgi:hypothetical protein
MLQGTSLGEFVLATITALGLIRDANKILRLSLTAKLIEQILWQFVEDEDTLLEAGDNQ